jgi:hypothetical protein
MGTWVGGVWVGHTKQKVEGTGFQCVCQNFFNFWGCLKKKKGGHIYFAPGMKRAREEREGVEGRGGGGPGVQKHFLESY